MFPATFLPFWHFYVVVVVVGGGGGGGGGGDGCLFNVPATCECISETDLLRQFYVLPH